MSLWERMRGCSKPQDPSAQTFLGTRVPHIIFYLQMAVVHKHLSFIPMCLTP